MAGDFQDPERIVDAIEDPRTKPRTGATVIRLRYGRLDINTCPQVLVERGHMYKPDATKLCSQGLGILADNLEQKVAVELAAALEALGEACFIVAAAEVVALPPATVVASARLTKTELQPVDLQGKTQRCSWEQAVVLAMAHVQTEATETTVVKHNLLSTPVVGVGGMGVVAGAAAVHGPQRKTTIKSSTHSMLDLVFSDPLRRYRLDSHRFDFSLLGNQLQPTSEGNLHNLARWFLYAAPGMKSNLDPQKLAATGRADLHQLSERQFDDLSHWLLNLIHFGKEPLPVSGG